MACGHLEMGPARRPRRPGGYRHVRVGALTQNVNSYYNFYYTSANHIFIFADY